MFDPTFTENDVTQATQLIKRFCIKHEKNIIIIFDYFFDELKPLIWNKLSTPWQSIYPVIDLVPRAFVRPFAMKYLKNSGASHLISLMYGKQTNLSNNTNEISSTQLRSIFRSPLNPKIFFLIFGLNIFLYILYRFPIFRLNFFYLIGFVCTVLVFLCIIIRIFESFFSSS